MEEATREIVRGLSSHYELEGRTIPERVTKAVEGIKAFSQKRWKTGKGTTDPYHAQLWIFGNAVGEACWLNGQAAGVRRKAPCERKDPNRSILKRATAAQLVGPSRLSTHCRTIAASNRFTGEQDALESTLAVAKIESAIPAQERAFAEVQLKSRQKLIRDWWRAVPQSVQSGREPRDPYAMKLPTRLPS
jgi:hypothetical protein